MAHNSPAHRPAADSGGVRWHYRGRRASRIVQTRRLRARNSDEQRRLDYDRALIPLPGPGLAPGTGVGPTAHTRGRPGPANGGCWRGSGSWGSRLPRPSVSTTPAPNSNGTGKLRHWTPRAIAATSPAVPPRSAGAGPSVGKGDRIHGAPGASDRHSNYTAGRRHQMEAENTHELFIDQLNCHLNKSFLNSGTIYQLYDFDVSAE